MKVSAISLGGWLTAGSSVEDQAFQGIVRKAIEGGINYFDVADVYARGGAEKVLGGILSEYKRSDLVLASKVFWPMSQNVNDRGLSRKHIMESVDKSLQRLKTDYLDIYFCHRYDPETPLVETAHAMDDLVRQGKILYWGTSVWTAQQVREVHSLTQRRLLYSPVVEQPKYSLLAREIEHNMIPTARELGFGLVVWSPLAGGLLTGKYNDGVPAESRASRSHWLKTILTEANLKKVRRLTEMAQDLGHTTSQLALAWLLHRAEVASVITGATRPEHIESNLKAAEIKLSWETQQELETLFPVL